MKIITILIAASAVSAVLVGCSGHGHDGFDTNGAEMSAYPGDEGRRPGETNGEAAARVGKEVYVFQPDKPMVTKTVQVDSSKLDVAPVASTTKKNEKKVGEAVEPVAPTASQEAIDTSYYETTTASSVEEAPKTKKELRKEKRDARKATKKNN